MKKQTRPAAVPLVLSDPFFNVWSFADTLHGDATRHWTGQRQALVGMAVIDGALYRFCGLADVVGARGGVEPEPMTQLSLTVSAASTEYVFEAGGVELTVTFTSPVLPGDLHLLSRPLTYIRYAARGTDGRAHAVKIYTDITGEWCVNTPDEPVLWGLHGYKNAKSASLGTVSQQPLNSTGDDHRINWGYVHLINPSDPVYCGTLEERYRFLRKKEWFGCDCPESAKPQVSMDCPIIACESDFGEVTGRRELFIAVAYDDVKSIEYFGEQFCGYWQKDGMTFAEMVESAVENADCIFAEAAKFDNSLYAEAALAGGRKYADLCALAYRQAVCAHKLIADSRGDAVFLSKENYSNGCIGTVDVSYPSIPLFLLCAPELVRGMMRPIFRFAASDAWKFPFAPHVVGQYPKANGQVYGREDGELVHEYQMPIEECGNMLVMAAASTAADGETGFIKENLPLLRQWAEYLSENGFDPENQLCTDDFAGHLAHNCNLSVKAIMGIACFGLLLQRLGDAAGAEEYLARAKGLAQRREAEAKDGCKYRLAFDKPGTWSLKYNIVWDKILGLRLFSDEVTALETAWYIENQNKYGVALDSRRAYTKTDWLVWAASLCENPADFEALIEPLWRFVNETPDRAPFTDWYDTVSGRLVGFRNRTVIGGVFIRMLAARLG